MRHSARLWLGLILLAAFALRLFRLGWNSLWYDETVSLYLARQDLVALTRHTAGDIHPPLYYYLLHFWGAAAGWSEFSAAFLSLVFGILLVALVYRVACEWINSRVGLIAALLVAVSPYNLWYSAEVRMYTLGAVLGLGSVFFFVRLFGRSRADPGTTSTPHLARDLIAYALVSALGLYTLYYFAFLLVFENLALLAWILLPATGDPSPAHGARHTPRSILPAAPGTPYSIRTWVLSQIAILVLYAPWIPVAVRQALTPPVPPWRTITPYSTALLESFSALALGQSIEPAAAAPVLVLVGAIAGVGLASARSRRVEMVQPGFLLGYTFVPFLLIYLLSLWKPLYHVRYMFIYSPAFYLLLAVGIDRIRGWSVGSRVSGGTSRIERLVRLLHPALAAGALGVILAGSAVSSFNFWFEPRYAEDDLRGAVRRVAALWRPGDAILINAGYTYTAFAYYYDQPVAWRGRLTDYARVLGDVPDQANAEKGAVVLQTGSIDGSPDLGWGDPESDFYSTTAEETRSALDRVFAAHPRVWLVRLYDTVVDPNGVIREYLGSRGLIFDDAGMMGESYARVQGYLTQRATLEQLPQPAALRRVLLGGRIVLLGFQPEAKGVRAGAPLDVDLYWQAAQPTNIDAHLFVGLYSEDGKLVAGTDELPLGNALGTSRWSPGVILRQPVRLRILANVPSGTYTLQVALYNPLTNEPLTAETGEGVTVDGYIKLTTVRLEN